jgi:sugar/nucleoside kinase (ribokinase family)
MIIWGFGTAAIDIRIKTADYGEAYRDKLLAQNTQWMAGGSTANTLAQVCRLGGKAAWLGRLGTDRIGEMILASLEREGICTEHVILEKNSISPFNLAVYAGGEMRRVGGWLLPNCLSCLSVPQLEVLARSISKGDYLLIEVGEPEIEACIYLAETARNAGATVVLDVDLDPLRQLGSATRQIKELFSLCHVLMPNIDSMITMYPDAGAEEVMSALAAEHHCTVILSLGRLGAAYLAPPDSFARVPAVDVPVTDTVGAGDAFHGGVIYGLSLGLNIKEAVILGNVCGAHNCRTFSARDGMASRSDLKQYNFDL